MRYIATNNLREGHVLAMDLVFSRDTVLLRKGKTLTSSLIQKIALLGYQGLYIEDELSASIEIDDVINPDLRNKTRSELELMFHNVEFNVTSSVKDPAFAASTSTAMDLFIFWERDIWASSFCRTSSFLRISLSLISKLCMTP